MSKRKKIWINILGATTVVVLVGFVCAVVGLLYLLNSYGRDLPDYHQLANYEPPVVSRIYAGDGSLLSEYARQKRLFVPISAIPKPLIQAFISAEDKTFYTHGGIDYLGVLRAVLVNVKNAFSGRRPVGASTITQQVAKNFLLSGVVSYERKIKEAILAYRIERAFTKDEILELYLNEIYLGAGSYGVAAASLYYFNKSLDELTLEEMAYLAALPKAPNNYHPVRKYDAAVGRRNWVLGRMAEEGYISKQEASEAGQYPLVVRKPERTNIFKAEYFTEEVRRELKDLYGDDELYGGGLFVRTTLSPRFQAIAERELKNGLITYDRRHGYKGPVTRFSKEEDWQAELAKLDVPLGIDSWQLAVVRDVQEERASILTKDGTLGQIPLDEVKWARKWLKGEYLGPRIKAVSEVLAVGDVIIVEQLPGAKSDQVDPDFSVYGLRQIPEINGGIVAMDPHTGRVLALSGGFDYSLSEYNRATQAKRQPGSAFKPFVYAVALEKGFTPSSLILDAPFVMEQGFGLGKWKPKNSSDKFYGPSTLRLGLEKSRNLMTVRLAQYIKMDGIVDIADRMGITHNLPPLLSMSLGAGDTTLMNLTAAYGMIVNGGKKITPTLIDRIQDRYGDTIFRHDKRECENCQVEDWQYQEEPKLPDERKRVLDAVTAYQLVSMMEGVVQRGTGIRIRALGKPLAGKTGTSNDSFDTWFIGFSPDLVVGVFAGFDTPRSLGNREEGASVAVPIFRDFMKQALRNEPSIPFRIPPGVRLVRVNPKTGQIAQAGEKNTILEAFRQGTFPTKTADVLDGFNSLVQTGTKVRTGTGGIY
ncbi:penicillin-binding protein 1A [Emcibacter nanhaiensis]|uniref:Penicillin-binding protein 1A n=1 Tax=Emcibacter nanhaiensis TaxID=1505037 RepID=A0A501PR16_9PROT|nr:penicillin-binding protein 1A [Emcibacter nanhaiensis]TPD62970.1 penicillin-binding protein 1A [Emcibacter nanhaiensis]